MRRVSSNWLELPGWLTENEGLELQAQALNQDVLEIGCYHGRSTVCMGSVCRAMTCIDHFRGDSFVGDTNAENMAKYWRENVKAAKLTDKIKLIQDDFTNQAEFFSPASFGFIFYDADHTGEAVKHFLDWWFQSDVTIPPPVAIHDYDHKQKQYADSVRVIDEYCKTQNLRRQLIDRLLVLSV